MPTISFRTGVKLPESESSIASSSIFNEYSWRRYDDVLESVKDCAPPELLSLMDEKLVLSMRSGVDGGIECLRFFCVAPIFVLDEGEKGGTFLGRCGSIVSSTAIVTENFQSEFKLP